MAARYARTLPLIELMARAGYAARGSVNIMVAAFAIYAAFVTPGAKPTGSKGAMVELWSKPFGTILLALLAFGLAGFALWRFLQGLADADRHGTAPKAVVRRVAYTVTGVIYVGLAVFAVSLVFGLKAPATDDDSAARDWTTSLLSIPFGRWLVAVVGLCLVGAGIAAVVKGWRAKFQQRLALDNKTRPFVVCSGRIGFVARGIVFVIAGTFLVLAGWNANPNQAVGLSGALAELQRQPWGWALLGVVGVGLFAFGVFDFAQANYRRVTAFDIDRVIRKVA